MFTEEGVYGLIVVSGLIAASAGSPAGRTLVFLSITVVVFWIAHVYAGAVTAYGKELPGGGTRSVAGAIRHAAWKSRGLLAATLPPAAALFLGAINVLQDQTSKWVALWVCVGVLAWVGYLAFRKQGAKPVMRVIGAISTASSGLIIILAKALVSH